MATTMTDKQRRRSMTINNGRQWQLRTMMTDSSNDDRRLTVVMMTEDSGNDK